MKTCLQGEPLPPGMINAAARLNKPAMLRTGERTLHVEMLHAKLRPVFQPFQFRFDRFYGFKASILKVIFTGLNLAGFKLHDVDDSQVDAANFGRVIVDQPDDALLTVAFNADFFVEFSLHARAIPIVTGGVLD